MRLTTIVLMVLFLGGACGRKIPPDVVPQQQMGNVLLDMHLADGQLASMLADSARRYRDAYYDAIFNRYAIDSVTFERSVEFYSSRPKLMKALYTGIEKQLEAYNMADQKATEEKYNLQRKADSIATSRHMDSLRKVTRDSLDLKRKRYLLYIDGPDSLGYGQPIPITHALLRERLMETVGLRDVAPLEHILLPRTVPVAPPAAPIPAPKEEDHAMPPLRPLKKAN
ncbi:DUF4296 domain-containing protein [Parapedobacter sp. 2B3]|uniref:DUF4296 domain-containing protein n=1 Tax=Parapedobacter sp. 2B3 TaxID=3342381 RepID=UPI0035B637B4